MTLLIISYFGGQFLLEEWKTLVVTFVLTFLFVWFFLNRGASTVEVTLAMVIPVEHQNHPLVVGSLSRFAKRLKVVAAADLAVTTAVCVWLIKSLHYPVYLPLHLDVVKVCEVCRRAGLLCLDKTTGLEEVPRELYLQLRTAAVEGQNLYFEWGDFFRRFTTLEGKTDYLLHRYVFLIRLLLMLVVFLLFWGGRTLLSRFKKSVYLLLVPSGGQLPPPVWARLLLPLGVTVGVGYFFFRWRRSGSTWEQFLRSYFFRGGATPGGIASFFDRLGYLLGFSAVVPFLVGWINFSLWFEYLPSYLYPELGEKGLNEGLELLKKIGLRLQHLQGCPDFYDPVEVQKLTLEFKELSQRYCKFTQFVLDLTPRVKELYPLGYPTPPFRWKVLLLRGGWTLLVLSLIFILLILANRFYSKVDLQRGSFLMFFFFDGELIHRLRWWGVLSFFVTFFLVFFFLRRVDFPRWVHPMHYLVPSGVLQTNEVNQAVVTARDYLRAAISVVVAGYVGVQVWLFPLVSSQPLGIHPDGVYVVIQLQRVCLLLVDKFHHPPSSFGETLRVGLYSLGYEFEQLKNSYISLFREVALLEGPPPTSWLEVAFLGFVFSFLGVLALLFVRGPRRGVLILVIPAVGQVPVVFWVRFFFPVLLVFVATLLLWGWRRSGKEFELFFWELFFPGNVEPSRVVTFFNRLKWFLLVTGLTPLVWLGCDLWWIYLNSKSYLFPELNLDGLRGVPPRLDRLFERIHHLDVSVEVQRSLLQRAQTLSDQYNCLVRKLTRAEELVSPHYPEGVIFVTENLTFLFRRLIPVAGVLLVGLLVLTRRKNFLQSVSPLMFFKLTRDDDLQYPWWSILAFLVFFILSFLFLRRVNFPRWVHPVHYFLAPEFLSNPEVIKSIEQSRRYLHVGISTTVGALTGFIFWLSPFLRSYPFDFYPEGMHLYLQVNGTCRLLLDKLNYLPPGSFTPCTDHEVAQLSHLFNQLSSNLLKLSAQVSRLEDPPPFLWSSLLWFVPSLFMLLIFTSLAIRGPRRGVFVFVIPGVTQVTPTFWVRFFFPLLLALLVGVFLWGWRRSGKDFVTFNQELYFPPGTDPSRVVTFFNRLRWFLLVTGAMPLLWMGLDFWWICSCSKSYLFPELNTSGLSRVPLLLDHLHDSILNLRVEESTREDFLLRWVTLEDEFYRLSGYLLQLDEVIRSAYPAGVALPYNNLILLLRRGWGVLSLLLVGGLLFSVRIDRKGLPR